MLILKPRVVLAVIAAFPLVLAGILVLERQVLEKPVLGPALAGMFPKVVQAFIRKPLAIAPITPVSLIPTGSGSTDLSIVRDGRTGPVTIELTGIPEGVTASVQPIAVEASTARVEFTAADSLGDTDVESHITVRASIADESASQQLLLRVPKVGRPVFLPPSTTILKPGMEEAVTVKVRRNGFAGPLVIRAIDPPPGVDVTDVELPGGSSAADIRVIVGKDSAEGTFPIPLTMSAYGRAIGSELSLVIDSMPYRLRALQVVRLRPGETAAADVPVERNSFMGPIRVAAVDLPAGVTMPHAEVAPGQTTACLLLRAGESALPGVQAVMIRATGGRFEDEGTIVIRVMDPNDDGALPRDVIAAEAIGRISGAGSLGSRTSASGKVFLKRLYGTSAKAEAAVARGLDWLAQAQAEDGSWTSAMATADDPAAATSLALLPFLAEGVTHRRSSIATEELVSYRTVVERGLRFLARSQNKSPGESPGMIGKTVTAHAMATLAMAEAYGLSKHDKLRPYLKSAIAVLIAKQQDGDGGWRDRSEAPEDLSTTAWAVMAFRSARHAHVAVSSKALKRAENFTVNCAAGPAASRQSRYADFPGGTATPPATATGLFLRQLLGWPKSEPALIEGCAWIMGAMPPNDGTALDAIDYHFFATQVLRNMEGADFDLWHHLTQEHLVRTQEQNGSFSGSWPPVTDAPSIRASRVYSTSLALLTLQTCYRHLPLYRPVTLRAEDPIDDESEDTDGDDTDDGPQDERP